MPYFLSQENLHQGKLVSLTIQETRHLLLSHRAKKGEKVKLQGPDKKRFLAEVLKIGKKSVELRCINELSVPSRPSVRMVLFQALVAEKALDFILQKGTELGVDEIVLFNARNSAVKLTAERFTEKKERWEKILVEAAKQSENSVWPQIIFLQDVKKTAEIFKEMPLVYLADINGGKPDKPAQGQKIGIVIGPEGGFTEQELNFFKNIPNVKALKLGEAFLRAETAALSAVAGIKMISDY